MEPNREQNEVYEELQAQHGELVRIADPKRFRLKNHEGNLEWIIMPDGSLEIITHT